MLNNMIGLFIIAFISMMYYIVKLRQQQQEQRMKEQQLLRQQQEQEIKEHQFLMQKQLLRQQQKEQKIKEQQLLKQEQLLREQQNEQRVKEQQLLKQKQLLKQEQKQQRDNEHELIKQKQLLRQQQKEQRVKEKQLLKQEQLLRQHQKEQRVKEQQLLKQEQLLKQHQKEQRVKEQQILKEEQVLRQQQKEQRVKEQQLLKQEQQILKEQQLLEQQEQRIKEQLLLTQEAVLRQQVHDMKEQLQQPDDKNNTNYKNKKITNDKKNINTSDKDKINTSKKTNINTNDENEGMIAELVGSGGDSCKILVPSDRGNWRRDDVDKPGREKDPWNVVNKYKDKKVQYPSVDPKDLDRDFPYFSPKIIGYYSLNERRSFMNDESELPILKPENEILGTSKEYDLDVGFEHRPPDLHDPENPEYLDNLLKWILANKNQIQGSPSQIFGTDFIAVRSIFTDIIKTEYDRNIQDEGWIIRIMKWKNTIFICKEVTEKMKNREKNATEKVKRLVYWGSKFEDYMTNTRGSKQENESKHYQPVNTNPGFYAVFKSKIEHFKILYGAQMDAYQNETEDGDKNLKLDINNFVELKTSKKIEHPGQRKCLLNKKFASWWSQTFLVGTKNVVVGWKDENGVVKKVEKIPVHEMLRLAEDWKGNIFFNLLLDVLKFVKEAILKDSLTQVYRLSWFPETGFNMEMEKGTKPFIPEWFYSEFI